MGRLTNTSVDSRNSNAVRIFCDTQTALKKLKQYEDIGTIEEFSKLNKAKNINTNEKDKFKLLEEYMREFAIKLDKIGFDVLGSKGNNSIELEIVHKENER